MHFCERFENIPTSLSESYAEGANDAFVFVPHYKLMLLIYFKPNADNALLDECDFAKFVQLVNQDVVLEIVAWLKVSKEALHELTVCFVIPCIKALSYFQGSPKS